MIELHDFTARGFGTATVAADPLVRIIRIRDATLVVPEPTYFALDGALVDLRASWGGINQPCYIVSHAGEPHVLLARNATFVLNTAELQSALADSRETFAAYAAAVATWATTFPKPEEIA